MGFRRKSSDLYESASHLKYILLILSKFEEKPISIQMLILVPKCTTRVRKLSIICNIARGPTGREHFIF